MNQDKQSQILQAIRQDDLAAFSSLLKGNKTLSFGRFPLLTLCYLYKAKKIIKNYQAELIKIQNYIIIQEPISIYKDFKNVAGKCMRLYLLDGAVVSPLEMLAILHKDGQVKKLFNSQKSLQSAFEKIKKIYTMHGQNVENFDGKIKISRRILSYNQKKKYKVGLYFAISCVAFISVCLSIFSFVSGLGTSFSPFVVCSQTQLTKALASNGNYVLSADITINEFFKDLTFSGTLDGNNKTIFINDTSANYLILNNKGTIKNLNIVYTSTNRQISSSFSLLSNTNSGTIQNVNISCEGLSLEVTKSGASDIYINAFANTNAGVVKNCSLKMQSQITASGDGECYVSGFVGKNTGSVENCIFNKDSSFTTFESDLSGIVTNNEFGAQVTGCKNHATLTQNSQLNGWSPNVAGIVQTNYGKILNCFNLSSLSVNSLNNEEAATGNVFLGGICALNYGEIEKCLNKGSLNVESKKIIVYTGGICAYSSYWVNDQLLISSSINSCGVDCQINVQTENEKAFAFIGGISGYLYGTSKDCYSVATFTTGYDNTKYFVGSFLGSAYLESSLFGSYIRVTISNDFVLQQENITYQIGSLINGNQIITGLDSPNEEIKTISSLEELKQQEVYWSEK